VYFGACIADISVWRGRIAAILCNRLHCFWSKICYLCNFRPLRILKLIRDQFTNGISMKTMSRRISVILFVRNNCRNWWPLPRISTMLVVLFKQLFAQILLKLIGKANQGLNLIDIFISCWFLSVFFQNSSPLRSTTLFPSKKAPKYLYSFSTLIICLPIMSICINKFEITSIITPSHVVNRRSPFMPEPKQQIK
jgi:hypothetical protein